MSIYLLVTAHPRTTQNSRQRHTTTNMGTSYRPISLLSVVAKTLKKCLLPYITANITQTPTQHGHKVQHSTVTALHQGSYYFKLTKSYHFL